MSDIVITVVVKPSSDLLLAMNELAAAVQEFARTTLSAAIERPGPRQPELTTDAPSMAADAVSADGVDLPKWTDKRDELLTDGLNCLIPADDILDQLRSMPGAPLTQMDFIQRAKDHGPASKHDDEYRDQCVAIFNRERAAGTGWDAIIGAIYDYQFAEDQKKREAKRQARLAAAAAKDTPKASWPGSTGAPVAAQNGGTNEPPTPTPAAGGSPPHRTDWSDPKWCTPERRAALIRMYQSNVRLPVIKQELEKLSGSHLPSAASLQTFAIQVLRVKRDKSIPTFKRSAPVPPTDGAARIRANSDAFARAMTLPKQPIDVSTPIPVDFQTASAKAATWGLEFTSWADLTALNEKAHRIGHRPFCQERAVR